MPTSKHTYKKMSVTAAGSQQIPQDPDRLSARLPDLSERSQEDLETKESEREGDSHDGERQGKGKSSKKPRRQTPSPPPGLTEPPGIPQASGPVTLEMLFQKVQKGATSSETQHREFRHYLARVDRQIGEIKTTAAKALTTSQKAEDQIKNLQERVERLEKTGSSPSSPASDMISGFRPSPHASQRASNYWMHEVQKTRQQLLGGEQGNAIVIGGFPRHRRRAQLEQWVEDVVRPTFPEYQRVLSKT